MQQQNVSVLFRYFIQLSYCGTPYNGWQSKPHLGTITVQSEIENVMTTLLREPISLTGCGRTDTGVHARDYFAHFDISEELSDLSSVIFRINKMLPSDIAIHNIYKVSDSAHARFDAISRSYQYHLHTAKSPFLIHSHFYTYGSLDLKILNEAASIVLEYKDFTTFCKSNTDVKTMICLIEKSYWTKEGNTFVYHITSDRFLRGMIRLIVGMCLNVCRGKLTTDEVRYAIDNKIKTKHDWSVPAVGLFLCDIRYPYL